MTPITDAKMLIQSILDCKETKDELLNNTEDVIERMQTLVFNEDYEMLKDWIDTTELKDAVDWKSVSQNLTFPLLEKALNASCNGVICVTSGYITDNNDTYIPLQVSDDLFDAMSYLEDFYPTDNKFDGYTIDLLGVPIDESKDPFIIRTIKIYEKTPNGLMDISEEVHQTEMLLLKYRAELFS